MNKILKVVAIVTGLAVYNRWGAIAGEFNWCRVGVFCLRTQRMGCLKSGCP